MEKVWTCADGEKAVQKVVAALLYQQQRQQHRQYHQLVNMRKMKNHPSHLD